MSKHWIAYQPAVSTPASGSAHQRMVSRFPRRPGKGWKAYEQSPVWEHVSGIRVHALGLCRLKDGTIIDGSRWPESNNLQKAVREQGGTNRRGLMVWGLEAAHEIAAIQKHGTCGSENPPNAPHELPERE